MTIDTLDRQQFGRAIHVRLRDHVPHATIYYGEIDGTPPANPQNGRVLPYAVIYPFGGRPHTDEDLGDGARDLVTGAQVTCVAGYTDDCLALADRVDAALRRWPITVDPAALATSGLRFPDGFDPGSVLTDPDVSPPRFYLPLQYVLLATT